VSGEGGKRQIRNLVSRQPERDKRVCGQVPLIGAKPSFMSNPGIIAEGYVICVSYASSRQSPGELNIPGKK